MRVLHVVRQYHPSVGGLEDMVRSLAKQQLQQGQYQPSVLTLDRVFRQGELRLPPREQLDGVTVQRLPYYGSERYPLCPRVFSALRDADLVHVHGIDFFFDALGLTQQLHRRPLIASTHGGFFHTTHARQLKQLYFQTVTRIAALGYDRVIATSDNDGLTFSRVCKAPKLQVIENGVDVLRYAFAGARRLTATLIYFGRWSANKGLPETLDLLAQLRSQDEAVDWRLLIAGREYDLCAADLRDHADSLRIAQHVELHPNPDTAQMRALIGRASYFICLSHHEGFGIAPVEAMSAGLETVLSDIAPFRRLVQHSGNGLVLESHDSVMRAQQIARLHQRRMDMPLAHEARRQSAVRAAQAYAWPEVAQRYSHQYDQVLQNS